MLIQTIERIKPDSLELSHSAKFQTEFSRWSEHPKEKLSLVHCDILKMLRNNWKNVIENATKIQKNMAMFN